MSLEEAFLLKIALVVSVIGIVFLYIISTQIELNDTTIEKITSGNTGEDKISLTGVVKSVKQTGQTTFITLSETKDIEVVVFSNDVGLAAGNLVKVTGRVQEYKGEKEIIADKIEIK